MSNRDPEVEYICKKLELPYGSVYIDYNHPTGEDVIFNSSDNSWLGYMSDYLNPIDYCSIQDEGCGDGVCPTCNYVEWLQMLERHNHCNNGVDCPDEDECKLINRVLGR